MSFLPSFYVLRSPPIARSVRKCRPHERKKMRLALAFMFIRSRRTQEWDRECKPGAVQLVASDSKTAIFRMKRSVGRCTVLHCVFECIASVCVCTWSNIPAGLRGSAVVGAILLCAACHWWIKEDYSWGRRTFGLKEMEKKK